ncbi:MAG: hypothetical protein LUE96_00930 [Lachnospiraceae bacterium]|nr:hypothetical protein [Lachnospiraceae bacterium]
MFKPGLFKRALPVVLSVAMTFQSMPVTALAAEDSSVVTEDTAGESEEANDAAEEADAAESTEADADNTVSESASSEASEASESSEATETIETTEASETASEAAETMQTADAETEEATQTAETEKEAEVADVNEDGSTTVSAVIDVDYESLKSYVYDDDLSYTSLTDTVSSVYDEDNENPFGNILSKIKDSSYGILTVTDESTGDSLELVSKLTCTWQSQNSEGEYSDMASGDTPYEAGAYRLYISLDEKYATAEAVTINFEIEQREIEIGKGNFNTNISSGDTVAEVIEDLKAELSFTSGSDDDDFSAYVGTPTIVVRYTTGTEALADGEKLLKGSDYSIDISAEPTDTANYTVKSLTINLNVAELKKTELTITDKYEADNETDITRTYTGAAITAPVLNEEITVVVTSVEETDETTGEALVLVDNELSKLTASWTDADGNELTETPVDAGAYYYVLTYTDSEGVYADAEDMVKVVVEPAALTLIPSLSDTDYYVGALASDVTAKAAYTLQKEDGTPYGYDEDTFWGVSYSNTYRNQSYEPVFTLQMGTTTTEDGKSTTTWEDLDADDEIEYPSGANTIDEENVTIAYRLVFAGEKALFSESTGNIISGTETSAADTSTNSAEKNYAVDVTDETLEANAVDVTVSAATKVTIDTSAMLPDGVTASDINTDDKLYSKVYDGEQLYTDRAAYKKAVVTADGTQVASNTDSSLTYTWYEFDLITETELDDEGNEVTTVTPKLGDTVGTSYTSNPSDAGYYALEVSYTDADHVYADATAYVYFEIEEQIIRVVPTSEVSVYEGWTISELTENRTDELTYTFEKLKDNDLTAGEWEAMDTLSQADEDDKLFTLDWFVLKGDSTDASTASYTKIGDEYDESFALSVPYKLGACVTLCPYDKDYNANAYYGNYICEYTVTEDGTETEKCAGEDSAVSITVNAMGTTELDITIETTKLTSLKKTYDGTAFDISEAIANGLVTVTKKNTDDVVVTTGDDAEIALTYVWTWNYDGENYSEAVNAGTYGLYVYYEGGDTYKNTEISDGFIAYITIDPRELTITPGLISEDEIVAGISAYSVIDGSAAVISGYIDADTDAFSFDTETETIAAADAIGRAYAQVTLDDAYAYYLRTGKTYVAEYSYVSLNEDALADEYADNYELVYTPVTFTVTQRGNSTADEYDYYYSYTDDNGDYQNCTIAETGLTASYGNQTVTVKPLEGIAYSYDVAYYDDDEGETVELGDGNWFTFEITAPAEFMADGTSGNRYPSNFMSSVVYKNSILNNGGYVLESDSSYIIVAFEASAFEENPEFDIVWENGYTEHYVVDLSEAELEANLTEAVAPKSLAFNGVDSKMVVGETQQLDVKITKTLLDDVICLNYAVVDGDDVVSITEDGGYVTALSKGSATVEVYPVKYDKQGNAERLDFKSVTAKLTVSDVSAPKISKVTAYGNYVEVKYTKPSDGYRREIYVMEGKNLKPESFETAIENGTVSLYGYANNYEASSYYCDGDVVTCYVSGLEPETEYTVYIRNVSGIRTLEDGSLVVSSKAGATKGFKTTKVQLDEIALSFDEEQYYDETNPIITYNEDEYREEVALSQGSLTIDALGEYARQDAAADADDKIWLNLLEIGKDSEYLAPKLTFYALNGSWHYIEDSYSTAAEAKKDGKTIIGDKYYGTASSIAKVDKKGTIKLSGVGYVYIVAYDSISGEISEPYELYVSADIGKITAKKLTLAAGNYAAIYSGLTFYDTNGKKISVAQPWNYGYNVTISGDGVEYDDYRYLYAVAENAKATVTVSLEGNSEVKTSFDVTTKAMDKLKSLKAANVMDTSAELTFTYGTSATDIDNLSFKIDVRNNKNVLVSSDIVSAGEYRDWDNSSSKAYAFCYYLSGLTRKSTYKVSVTPIYTYEDVTVTGKAATATVKTTDVPAYSGELLESDSYGGMDIYVTGLSYSLGSSSAPYLTSGHDYTFVAKGATYTAATRGSDTLTWKSSDSKVGSVKAVAGTYTATFKALKVGVTTIEVSSKLRKGVIARYLVRVKAVGAAGDSAIGDYAEEDKMDILDPYYTSDIEVLTEDNPVRFTSSNGTYDYKWVKFTAPAYGEYSFSYTGDVEGCWKLPDDTDSSESVTGGSTQTLNEGETVYFKIAGSFYIRVDGTKYTKLTTKTSVSSSVEHIIFTAPEDNYYTFEATAANMSASCAGAATKSLILYNADNSSSYTKARASVGLEKGEKITLTLNDTDTDYEVSVSKRTVTTLEAGTPVSITGLTAGDEKWYSYTAAVPGSYTFASTDASAAITATVYADITTASSSDTLEMSDDDKNFSETRTLGKDETLLFCVTTESTDAVTANISVSAPATDTVVEGTSKNISVAANSETWVSFTADDDDAKYTLTVDSSDVTVTVCDENGTALAKSKSSSGIVVENKGDNVYVITGLSKGTVIYICIENDGEEAVTPAVLVEKAAATPITAGASQSLTVENGGKYLYSFEAEESGLYVFRSKVTANDGSTHTLYADRYTSVSSASPSVTYWAAGYDYSDYDFYKEIKLTKGATVIFEVYSNDTCTDSEGNAVTMEAEISVTKVNAGDIPDEITFDANDAGATQWFKYKVTEDDTYAVDYEETTGSTKLYYSINGLVADDSGDWNRLYDGDEPEFSAGDTIYFRVVNTDTTEAKAVLTLTGKYSTREDVPSSAFTVKAGETNAYKFDVTETGRYQLTYTVSDGSNVYVYVNDTTRNNGYEFVGTLGETYYFDVKNNGDADATVTLTITKIVPTSIEAGESVEPALTAGVYQWYEFEAPATARYVFSASNANVYYSTTFPTLTRASNPTEVLLKKGTTYYIRLYSSEDATAALSVSRIVPTTLTAGTAAEANLKSGETQYFEFTAGSEAFYKLALELADNMEVNAYYYRDASDESDSIETDDEGSFYFESSADSSMLIALERTDSNETETLKATLTVSLESEPLVLEESTDLDITVKSGEYRLVTFTPSATYRYAFYAKDVPDGVTLTGWSLDDYGVELDGRIYTEAVCEIPDTVSFVIGAEFDGDGEKTFKLRAEKVTATAIENNAVEGTVDAGMAKWYSYTTTEAGYYTFANECDLTAYTYDEITGGITGYIAGGSSDNELMLAGKTIYIRMNNTGSSEAADVKLTITVDVIPSLTLNQAQSVSLEAYDDTYYKFTAPSAGNYAFYFEGIDYYRVYGYLYDSELETLTSGYGYSGYDFAVSQSLAYGETVYLNAYNYRSYTQEFTVTAMKLEENLTLSLDSKAVAVWDSAYTYKYVTFTAPETGFYDFSYVRVSGSLSSSNVTISTDGGSSYYALSGYGTGVLLAKDAEATVRLYNSSASTVAMVSVAKSASKTIETLSVDSETSVSAESGSYVYKYYEFTAPSAGTYVIASSGNSSYIRTMLYDDTLSDYTQSVYTSGDFVKTATLAADETVYLCVYNNSYALDFTISVTQAASAEEDLTLSIGSPVTVAWGDSYDDEYTISFTAPETDYYTFAYSGSSSVSVTAYCDTDEEGNPTASSYLYMNYIEKNTTVTLTATSTSTNTAAVISVSASETLTPGTSTDVSLSAYERACYKLTVEDAGNYAIYSDGNTQYISQVRLYTTDGSYTQSGSVSSCDFIRAAELEESGTVWLYIYGYYATDFTLTASKVSSNATTVTTSEDALLAWSSSDRTYSYSYVSFTAPETGFYNFECLSQYSYVYYYGSDDTYSSSSRMYSGTEYMYSLTKDTTVYFGAYKYSSSSGAVKISVSEQEVGTLTLDSTETVSFAYDEAAWYSFTATDAGMYRFYSESYTGNYPYVYLYDADISCIDSTGGNFSLAVGLDAGETIYFKAYTNNTSYASTSFDVTVEKLKEQTITSGNTLTVSGNSVGLYKYTASEAGTYVISSEGNANYLVTDLYDSDYASLSQESSDYHEDFYKAADISANGAVYLYVCNYDSDDAEFVVTVQSISASDTTVSLDSDATVVWSGTDNSYSSKYVSFTPSESGYYRFSYTEFNGYCYYNGTDGSSADGNYTTLGRHYLESGTTYYVRVYNYAVPAVVKISVSKMSVLTLGSTQTVSAESGSEVWYAFKATSDGEYEFYSNSYSGGYPCVALYFDGYTYASYSSSGYFTIDVSLTADQVVFLELYTSSDTTTEVTFGVKECTEETGSTEEEAE